MSDSLAFLSTPRTLYGSRGPCDCSLLLWEKYFLDVYDVPSTCDFMKCLLLEEVNLVDSTEFLFSSKLFIFSFIFATVFYGFWKKVVSLILFLFFFEKVNLFQIFLVVIEFMNIFRKKKGKLAVSGCSLRFGYCFCAANFFMYFFFFPEFSNTHRS